MNGVRDNDTMPPEASDAENADDLSASKVNELDGATVR